MGHSVSDIPVSRPNRLSTNMNLGFFSDIVTVSRLGFERLVARTLLGGGHRY